MSGYTEVTVPDMMQAREARFFMQQTMLSRYPGAALVCLTMNVAGPVKTTPAIERAFSWGCEQIRAVLAAAGVLFEAEIHEKTGPEAVFVVAGGAEEIKRRLCALEDGCALGRLLDIDVIGSDGEKLSRTQLGLPPRKCLLCGQDAPVCARSRTHTVAELFARTQEIADSHFAALFARDAARKAQRALLYEVTVTPKPGLVDRANAGAHTDMDVFTFIDSACVLREYFETCVLTGLAHRGGDGKACFDALRVPGLLAEAEMKRATHGVNTHKGAIFSLGVFCAALGMGFDGEKSDVSEALIRCGDMTRERMEQELAAIGDARTFGEEIYLRRRIGGVRAEAASGFASVREAALPVLSAGVDAGLSVNDAGLIALVSLMAHTQDTNVLRRGGEEAARRLVAAAGRLHEKIRGCLASGTMKENMEEIRRTLLVWDEGMSAAGVSPGGCADLLALSLLALFVQRGL